MAYGRKTGGRKKGVANKITLDLVAALEKQNIDLVATCCKAIRALEKKPAAQADVVLRLMKFVYPERKAVEATVTPVDFDNVKIFVKWADENPNDTPKA